MALDGNPTLHPASILHAVGMTSHLGYPMKYHDDGDLGNGTWTDGHFQVTE